MGGNSLHYLDNFWNISKVIYIDLIKAIYTPTYCFLLNPSYCVLFIKAKY
jgi:hypothetical protein